MSLKYAATTKPALTYNKSIDTFIMHEILIINTGGTFNKYYDPVTGSLEMYRNAEPLMTLLQHFYNLRYKIINLMQKDSLEINDADREIMRGAISDAAQDRVLIVHGTDTMEQTADFLQQSGLNKTVVLTGAMVPFNFDAVEAAANFALGAGFLLAEKCDRGIYMSMHGAVERAGRLHKNRTRGVFERT